RGTEGGHASLCPSYPPWRNIFRAATREQVQSGEIPMAIKFGRPIESRTRFAPVPQPRAGSAVELDLASRPRRNRRTEWLRRLVREHELTTADLIWPLFLVEGTNVRVPVDSMPGIERL